jgi:hypothetical protein
VNEPQQVGPKDSYAPPGADDPPREWAREEAAYARQRDRLVREHPGWFVVLFRDELVGPFKTFGEAVSVAYGRFGDVQLVMKEIRPEEPPDWVSLVDLNHPSIKLLDNERCSRG